MTNIDLKEGAVASAVLTVSEASFYVVEQRTEKQSPSAEAVARAADQQCLQTSGDLAHRLGSFENFKGIFKKAALSVFGSGYAWLVTDGGRLRIVTTANQNTPVEQGLCPVLAIDVWEQAEQNYHNCLSRIKEQGAH